MKRIVIKKQRKRLIISLILIMIFGSIYICYTWFKAKNETLGNALRIAKTVEASLNGGMVNKLRAAPEDEGTIAYIITKKRLMNLVGIYKDIRYIYIYTIKDGKLYFMVDSEPEGSKDYLPPGQEYYEADEVFWKPFEYKEAIVTNPVTDRWGTWISVIIPMEDSETGEITAAFGMDYPVHVWNNTAIFETLHAFMVVFILFVLILTFFGVLNKNEIMKEEKRKLKEANEEITRNQTIIEQTKQNFNNFFNAIKDLLFVLDTEGRIIHMNQTVFKRLEYSEEDLAGKSVLLLLPENRREEAEKNVVDMLAGKAEFCPVPVVTKQGMEIPVETRLVMGEWNGQPAMFGVTKDISDIKKSEEKFSKAFRAGGVLMAISKIEDGCYIDVNAAFLNTLGFKREDVIGKKSGDLNIFFKKEQRDIFKKSFEANGNVHGVEAVVRGKDNTLHTGIFSADPINLGDTPCWLSTMTDITKRKDIEEELIRTKEVAEAASVAKGQFLANMSHEIRTSINGIVGFLQLLRQTDLDEIQKEYVNEGLSSSEVLLSLINDILDFSKIEAKKFTVEAIPFNLRAAVEDAVTTFTPRAYEKGILLYSFIKSDVPEEVIGDPAKLRQILNNLLSNAVKFTSKGEVAVNVTLLEELNNIASLRFEVVDTGIGISKKDQDKLFKPFTQADGSTTRKFGGTGLGLAISKELVTLMQGEIAVESTLGKATTFFFNCNFEIVSKSSKIAIADLSKLEELKVLILDDNKSTQKIIKSYLEEFGIHVVEMENVKNVIAELLKNAKSKPPIEIVIMDYQMRGMSVYELASAIKAIPLISNTKLILLTSVSQKGHALKARDQALYACLSKPVKRDELLNIILVVMGIKQEQAKNEASITSHTQKEVEVTSLPKILLAEDNVINRKMVVVMLKNRGLACDIAENGNEAYQAVLKNDYDIAFMDCQMPVMDGYEATEKIRSTEAASKHTIIIAMTADVMEGSREKCLKAGMDDYISKPIDFEAMFKMIEEYTSCKAKQAACVNSIDNSLELFVSQTGLSRKDAEEIFNDYIQCLPGLLKDMRAALDIEDYDGLARWSHQLKGSSGNLRINEIYELAIKLEATAIIKDKTNSEKLFMEIKNSILLQ